MSHIESTRRSPLALGAAALAGMTLLGLASTAAQFGDVESAFASYSPIVTGLGAVVVPLGLWVGLAPSSWHPWAGAALGGLTFAAGALYGGSGDGATRAGVALIAAVPAGLVAWGAARPRRQPAVAGILSHHPFGLVLACLGCALIALTASPTLASSWRGVAPWDLQVISLPRLLSPSGALWPLAALAVGVVCLAVASRTVKGGPVRA